MDIPPDPNDAPPVLIALESSFDGDVSLHAKKPNRTGARSNFLIFVIRKEAKVITEDSAWAI